MTTLPKILRLHQIVGSPEITEEQAERNRADARKAIAAGKKPNRRPKRARPAREGILDIAPSTWWKWVAQGRAPPPVRLGKTTGWTEIGINSMIESGQA
jgi:predicted DNA-binding transcriptional regulator AlpA